MEVGLDSLRKKTATTVYVWVTPHWQTVDTTGWYQEKIMGLAESVKRVLRLGDGSQVGYYSLAALAEQGMGDVARFPFCLKVILEQLIRMQGHPAFSEQHISELANWTPDGRARNCRTCRHVCCCRIYGGALRRGSGGVAQCCAAGRKDPGVIEPLIPVDLVVDHSVQLDSCGCRIHWM
jgi:aconitate hydratase